MTPKKYESLKINRTATMRTVVNDETHTDKSFLIARVIVEDGASALTTGINYRTIIIREGDRVRNQGRNNFESFYKVLTTTLATSTLN